MDTDKDKQEVDIPSLPSPKFHVFRRGEFELSLDGKDYSGIQHNLRFKTDTPIILKGLGFFGLHRKSKSNQFQVGVRISQFKVKKAFTAYPQSSLIEFYPLTFFSKELLKRREEFHVKFEKEIIIPAHMWIEIGFQLDPLYESVTFESMSWKECIGHTVEKDRSSEVTFTFLSSSTQISQVHYEVCSELKAMTFLEDKKIATYPDDDKIRFMMLKKRRHSHCTVS